MVGYVTLYDFADEPFNLLPLLIPAAVALAGLALYYTVRRIVRKPKRGGPWLRRMTMVMYLGIAMMLVSVTVLVVSVFGELTEYLGSRAAYDEGLVTVEGKLEELPAVQAEVDGGGVDGGVVESQRRGFAVGGVEFVLVETGVRYGYRGLADDLAPGSPARVSYYDRKGVNVILKLEVATRR